MLLLVCMKRAIISLKKYQNYCFHPCSIKKTTPKLKNFDLNEQERKVLRVICEEKNSAEIAEELSLSKRTIDGIRIDLLEKTESKNIAGLVIFAVLNNLVTKKDSIKRNFKKIKLSKNHLHLWLILRSYSLKMGAFA